MTRPPSGATRRDPAGTAVLAAVACVAGLYGWLWLSGQLAWRLATGGWMRPSAGDSLAALARIAGHASDPASAWAHGAADRPGPVLFYASALAVLAAMAAASAATVTTFRRLTRRPGSPGRGASRGARWATRVDSKHLKVPQRAAGRRLVLGLAARRGARRLLATEARHSVLVLGPTQSGKTSGLAIPALLEWDGPVIATSVKDDLARHTAGWRSRRGPVWVFDPTAGSGLGLLARWSPLAPCADWTGAQRTASWLVDATPARSGMADAAFWYSAAAKQLAPLLRAARCGGLTMAEVVRWTNAAEFSEPAQLLHIAGEIDAALALAACEGRDERIRSSVATTLETVLAPFEDPMVASWTSGCDVDLEALVSSGGTLYLCGPSHEQSRVQGLFASLVSAAVAEAVNRVAVSGSSLDPPLLVVLDEAANIAPVKDLDTLASTAAGLGVQLVTVCQDLSQLTARYGQDRARTIVNNHRAKLLLSGVSDLPTLDLLSGLAGEQEVREETHTVDRSDGRRTRSTAVAFRRLAPPDELRRVPPGEGVLVYGHLPPLRIRLRPWFRDRRLRGRAAAS